MNASNFKYLSEEVSGVRFGGFKMGYPLVMTHIAMANLAQSKVPEFSNKNRMDLCFPVRYVNVNARGKGTSLGSGGIH